MLHWYKDRNSILYADSRQEYIIEKEKAGGVTLTYGIFPNYKHSHMISTKYAKRIAEELERVLNNGRT